MPTREDVLRIRSIEDAFDLSTAKVRKRQVALIRVAYREDLLDLTEHAMFEADAELIPYTSAKRVAGTGKATSKDIDEWGERRVGVNVEGRIPDHRRIRAKVSWDDGYYVVTVHTI